MLEGTLVDDHAELTTDLSSFKTICIPLAQTLAEVGHTWHEPFVDFVRRTMKHGTLPSCIAILQELVLACHISLIHVVRSPLPATQAGGRGRFLVLRLLDTPAPQPGDRMLALRISPEPS